MANNKTDFLVTGVSSGLGKAIALELLDQNFRVLGVARSNAIELNAFENYEFLPLDLSSPTDLQVFLGKFHTRNSPRHIILNAAVLQNDSMGGNFQPDVFEKVMGINFEANLKILTHFVPLFRERGHGSFCVISTQSVFRNPGQHGIAYASSKAALTSIMEAYRLDPANQKLSFTTAFPASLHFENRFPLHTSYTTAAKKIVAAIKNKREVVYIPYWKFLICLVSKLISDRRLSKWLQYRFIDHSRAGLPT